MKVLELKNQINLISALVGRNPVIAVLGNFLIDKGSMYGNDLHVTLRFDSDSKGKFLCPIEPVKKLLAKLDKDDDVIFIAPDAAYKTKKTPILSVGVKINGTVKFKFESEEVKDYPVLPTVGARISGLSDTDINSILRCFNFTSNDELRPALTGVLVDRDNIVGTDGHIMVWNDHSIESVYDAQIFILPPQIQKVLKPADDKAVLHKANDSIRYAIVSPGYDIIFRPIDEKFPGYTDVIPKPKDTKYSVSINRAEFLKTLDLAEIAANATTHQVIITPKKGKLNVFAEDLDYNNTFEDNLEAVIKGNKKFSIAFNIRFMAKLLKESKDETTFIKMMAPNKPILIDEGILLMPVMISNYR